MLEAIAALIVIYLLFDIRHKVSNSQPKSLKTTIMDSSALIDGRIVDVAKSGFIPQRILIPKVVLQELQLLADGRDTHKRERARVGLDVVIELQHLKGLRVIIDEYMKNSTEKTDEILIQLAKERGAMLCTTDFNLNKVATAEGIVVLNVNELAQVMRPKLLPGETIEVKIIQKGEGVGQGVGYLDDGTMAVIDGASKMQGKMVTAQVERMIQTKAGKMIFAKQTK